ncbi:hypothetical protein HNQ07_000949 [Deinococcus metalli]|uniref:Tautomerase family protein n=1 Tax=Deinococcus metalli TaxID=1141878 RepID=A0A7W8KC78_9DEIO|nr:tautomerase family protein [Deinococcus metalli]MBB5375505.1 hypothetical protein [Deinococcus metalli]GHF28762.1 hypothetical protein GCM10017781_00910 [Deinococcus metalli]
MLHVKIYGHAEFIAVRRQQVSDAIQRAGVQELGLPEAGRSHRFLGLDGADFIHPDDRGAAHLIVEIHVMGGRTDRALRAYLLALQAALEDYAGVAPNDLDVILLETPPARWSVRGHIGDDLTLPPEVTR